MPTTSLNGATIHYDEHGDEHADAIVLLHGFPLNGRMWEPQTAELARRSRVIVPDFRGFGRSGETGAFTIEGLADDTHALVEQLSVGRIVLVGLSMGGYVALAYAAKHAETLRGLVLMDTKAEGDTADGKVTRDRMIAIVNQRGAVPIADAMLPKLIPDDVARERPEVARALRDMMEGTRPTTIAHALAAMRERPDRTPVLSDIRVPTLVIVGDKDVITPPEVTGSMAAKIPGAVHRVIAGSGHMSNMERPDEVNEALRTFLAEIP